MITQEQIDRRKKRQRVTNAMVACRRMISKGRFERAEEYAKANSFTVAEARYRCWDRGASLPSPAPVEAVTATPPEPAASLVGGVTSPGTAASEKPGPKLVNGWPEETEAFVWGPCRNKRLIILQLPDERQAAMWTQGRRFRNGLRVRVKLDNAVGDPIYFLDKIL